MKPINATVQKFESDDGKIFDSEEQCVHYELVKSGVRRSCPDCEGQGATDPSDDGRQYIKCRSCNGRGWQQLEPKWC